MIIPITEARNQLPKLVDEVSETMSRVTITKRGRARATLISTQEYEDLIETLEILSDPKAMASLKQSEKEMKEGKGKTLREIEKELGLLND